MKVDTDENKAGQAVEDLQRNETDHEIRQYVTFIVGDEVFAVDMAPVHEIIRVPDIIRVPLAPPALDGLANLRGKVLPIVSLRKVFNFSEREYDDATRAVVINLGQPLGFVVDKVASVIGVEKSKLEDVGAISSTVCTELLAGIIKDTAGHAMIMVIDFAKLIAAEFSEIASMVKQSTQHLSATGHDHSHDEDEEESNDELQLVSFQVAGQEYALPIEDVQEIVQVPEHIVQVPNAERHVLGVMTLRNRLLPLVSLRCLFSLPPQDANEQSRIVVISLKDSSVGVVMDSVNEVLRVHKSVVDAMPNLLAKDSNMADISQICRLNKGKRLVSIISADHMFRHSVVKEALNTVDTYELNEDTEADEQLEDDDDEQVVVFRLGKEEFGVPIKSVQEIVRIPDELTQIPKAPPFVEGVINLRGAILPVMDQRRRFGMPSSERNDRQRIMVFLFDGIRTGFIVDSVSEVLKIPKATIEPAPKLSGEQAKLIARVANLEKQKRIILLIDASKLVESDDLSALNKLGTKAV